MAGEAYIEDKQHLKGGIMSTYFDQYNDYNGDDLRAMQIMLSMSDLSDGAKLSIMAAEFTRIYEEMKTMSMNLQRITSETPNDRHIMVTITEKELKQRGIDVIVKENEEKSKAE